LTVRVLVTGLGTFWGSKLAQALEALDAAEVIIGVDTTSLGCPSNEPSS
jgi:UDP-glucose 4-epimerase